MKIYNVEQNTTEWEAVRIGIPTVSEFDRIITMTGKPSTQYEAYANRIIAELLLGHQAKEFEGNGWTDRGHGLEEDAVNYYAMLRDVEPIKVGFITNDEGTIGCSPDRIVGEDGLLEIKKPSAHYHVSYMLDNEKLRKAYHVQTQGQLLVTGRKWVDLMSDFPELEPVIIRVFPDEQYQLSMKAKLDEFIDVLNNKKEALKKKGIMPIHVIDKGKFLMAG